MMNTALLYDDIAYNFGSARLRTLYCAPDLPYAWQQQMVYGLLQYYWDILFVPLRI